MLEALPKVAVVIQHRTGTPADQITAETHLADLFPCSSDMTGLQCDIDEMFGTYLPGDTWQHWHTAADIVASVERAAE